MRIVHVTLASKWASQARGTGRNHFEKLLKLKIFIIDRKIQKPKEKQTIQRKEEEIILPLEDTPESVREAAPVSKKASSLKLPPSNLKESLSKKSIASVNTTGTATEHLEIESLPDYEDISASRATSGILCEGLGFN